LKQSHSLILTKKFCLERIFKEDYVYSINESVNYKTLEIDQLISNKPRNSLSKDLLIPKKLNNLTHSRNNSEYHSSNLVIKHSYDFNTNKASKLVIPKPNNKKKLMKRKTINVSPSIKKIANINYLNLTLNKKINKTSNSLYYHQTKNPTLNKNENDQKQNFLGKLNTLIQNNAFLQKNEEVVENYLKQYLGLEKTEKKNILINEMKLKRRNLKILKKLDKLDIEMRNLVKRPSKNK